MIYIDCDDFVYTDGRNIEHDVAARDAGFDGCTGDEQPDGPNAGAFSETHTNMLWRRRDDLANRTLHHHRIIEIHEMHRHGILLTPGGHIKDAWTGDGND